MAQLYGVLVEPSRLHSGLLFAVLMAVLVYTLLWRTTIGYRIRAVGLNPHAARYAGMDVPQTIVLSMTLSGMFAGLAGAVEILGLHHRMFEPAAVSAGYGFSGIVAALFGKLHPLGIIPASILFGGLLVGGDKMQRATQIPQVLILAILGLVVLLVVTTDYFVNRRTPDYPETSFVWGTATDTGESQGVTNVFAYEPRAEQGGYVSGILAAHLTESGIIGLVGPVDAGDAKLHVDGFVAGVRDSGEEAEVNISFTGSFGDTALAAEAANTHLQAGADVLTGSAQQVVGAIGVAAEAGVPWLGIQADQSPAGPDIVVATVLYDWEPTLLEIITSHQAGELGGEVFQLTLANGGQTMVYDESLPAEAVEAAQAAEQGIIEGSIEVVAEPRN